MTATPILNAATIRLAHINAYVLLVVELDILSTHNLVDAKVKRICYDSCKIMGKNKLTGKNNNLKIMLVSNINKNFLINHLHRTLPCARR